MSSLSCHILDTTQGTPASGIAVELIKFDTRDTIIKGETNEDGRVRFESTELVCGDYTFKIFN
ncbi:hydroxyisourate hydrolase [Vibrio hannami]|uniref:hydroxyisourate hydrolase n=1 Tax=Vibrio hannami TaxID=2717094 RepID=UPI00240F949E|nr:hydroxyisourate hydrolase [Vibrio hannami]MDG3085243.1 hydroxyisourate hydrolase [Vibrio hannami]